MCLQYHNRLANIPLLILATAPPFSITSTSLNPTNDLRSEPTRPVLQYGYPGPSGSAGPKLGSLRQSIVFISSTSMWVMSHKPRQARALAGQLSENGIGFVPSFSHLSFPAGKRTQSASPTPRDLLED